MSTATIHDCPRCGHQERRSDYLHLHIGRAHGETMTPEERTDFEAALAQEAAWLKAAGRHVKAALAISPIVMFYFFLVVALSAAGANLGFAFMGLPGIVAFCGFVYFLVFTRDRLPAVPGRAPTLDDENPL